MIVERLTNPEISALTGFYVPLLLKPQQGAASLWQSLGKRPQRQAIHRLEVQVFSQ